jgi:hypothetical protein
MVLKTRFSLWRTRGFLRSFKGQHGYYKQTFGFFPSPISVFVLVWCVKQLEQSLESGKLNERRTAEVKRSLKTLRNPDSPLIKLRQVMRTSFGDYRAKMAAEEKSAKLDAGRVKIVSVAASDCGIKESAGQGNNKVTFIKKAASKVAAPSDSSSESAATASGFKFSFKIPGDE